MSEQIVAQNGDQSIVQNDDQNVAESTVQNADQNVTQDVGQKVAEDADQNVAQNADQNAGQNVAQEAGQDAAQNIDQNAAPNAGPATGPNPPLSPFRYQSYFNLAMLLKIQSRIENLQRAILASNYTDTSEMFIEVRAQRQLLQASQTYIADLINGAINLMERYTGDMNAQRAMMILLKINLAFIGFNSILHNIEINVTIWDYVSVSKVISFILDIKEFTHYIESNFIRPDSMGINERLV